MSTFLMTTVAESGHLLRVLDLAQGAAARGHRVLVHAPRACADLVAAAGAEHIPFAHYTGLIDRVQAAVARRPPRVPAGPYAFWHFRRAVLESSRELVDELLPHLRRERVDALVHDVFMFGAAYAAELAGIPSAGAGNPAGVMTAEGLPMLFRAHPVFRHLFRRPGVAHAIADRLFPLARTRAALGLPPPPGPHAELFRLFTSDALSIVMSHRGFSPDVPLRGNQVFAGSIEFEGKGKGDAQPVPEVRPGTVLVSTTTTGNDQGLLRKVLTAVAPMGVPVLATAASATDVPSGLGEHVQVVPYLPHDRVLPRVTALITHGGWGTVSRALRHGVPMLILPIFGDQPLTAQTAEQRGLGYQIPLAEATPERIRERLRALLADEALRARVKAAAEEIAALRRDAVGVRALEELVARAKGRAPS